MLSEILSKLDWSWVVTILLGIVTFYLVKEWLNRRKYPPGPRAWPIFGNIFSLRTKNMNSNLILHVWPKLYKSIFTVWLTKEPGIVITNWELVKDGLVTQRNAFSGRSPSVASALSQGGYDDIIFSDYGPAWETLRRIGSLAVRKYADSEHLTLVASDSVDKCVNLMLSESEPFELTDYMFLVTYNVLASTAFGIRYDMDDPEFLKLKNLNIKINEDMNSLYSDFFPYLRFLFRRKENRIRVNQQEMIAIMTEKFDQHKLTYDSAQCRDFTDAILSALEEAKKDEKPCLEHMKDGNLVNVLSNLFGAGTETTKATLLWIFLFLGAYPEIQDKMRQEINENIKDRIPLQKDKSTCHYNMAVINESLRFRPIINFTLEHKTTQDTKLGEWDIQQNNQCFFHIWANHMNPEQWSEPDKFKPERFLEEDGSLTKARLTGFMPFGMGRRGCVGEKLARADLFLIVARFVQTIKISLPEGIAADFEPLNTVFMNMPKPFKINVEKV